MSQNSETDPIDRSPPISFLLSAETFYEAAKHLENSVRTGTLKLRFEHMPVYFLFSHAMELLLKAFLRADGVAPKDLKKFGHRLNRLYGECLKRGLKLESDVRALVDQVTNLLDDASQEHEFRYVRVGFARWPDIGAIRHVTDTLLAAIRLRIPVPPPSL